MIKAGVLACSAIAHFLLAGTAFAQSIEAARTAQDEGRFVEASRLAEALNTSEGYALAAESLVIYGYYIAEEPEKEALLNRATGLAEEAIRLDAANPEAHVQSAHAMGRHAQAIGMMKAVGMGYVEKAREAIEYALHLDPKMAAAHLSLASWHTEAINKGGFAARVAYGASRKRALAHYERAVELAPNEKVVYVEYALGLLLLKPKKHRKQARELLVRATETPSRDAFDRLLHEKATEKLAELDGK